MNVLPNQETEYLYLLEKKVSKEVHTNLLTWIEALESGRYRQGKGRLGTESEGVTYYCCLGVANEACDLGVAQSKWSLVDTHPKVGLRASDGEFCSKEQSMYSSLSKLNDHYFWDFNDIAKLLRDQLKFTTVVEPETTQGEN